MMRIGGKLSLIEQIADVCQASATLPWHTILSRALALIAEAMHAPRAALTLLDGAEAPITRLTFPASDEMDWEPAWSCQIPPAPAPPFARIDFDDVPDATGREVLDRVLPLLTPVIHSAALRRDRAAVPIIQGIDAAKLDWLYEERFTHLLTQLTQVIPNDAGDVILLQEGRMQVVGHVGSPRRTSSAGVAAGEWGAAVS